jgi:hypothetical protein
MEGLRATARGKKALTLAKRNQQLRARINRMRRVRADLVAEGSPPGEIEVFDSRLRAVEGKLYPAVTPSGPQLNDTVACAVAIAHDLLQSAGRPVRWTSVHRLASLLYEGATGETALDFSKYISKYAAGRIAMVRHGVMITGTTARIDTARDGIVWITANLPRLK